MNGSPPKQSLAEFLGSQRQQGIESEGEFTLDPARARQLLRDCQLANPHQYLMHLVSFLVGLRPSRIEVTSQTQGGLAEVRLSAPDVELGLKELRNPFSGLLGHAKVHLQELAIGLNAALGFAECKVIFRSGPYQAVYTNDGIETEEPGHHFPGLTVEIRRKLASRLSRKPLEELNLVGHHFVHCPFPLTLNGEQISKPVEAPSGGFKMFLSNDEEPLWVDELEDTVVETQQAQFSALLLLGDIPAGLDILTLGRLYTKSSPWSLEGSGWNCRVVLATSRLSKDLSQQGILQDRVYQNLMKYLRQKLLGGLLRQLTSENATVGLPGTLVDFVVDHSQASGQEDRAFELQSKQYESDRNDGSRLRKGLGAYRFGLLCQSRQDSRAESLLKSAEADFRTWRSTQEMSYEGHAVAPQVYLNWLKVKARYWLCESTPELQADLVAQAKAARGCPPMEEICYRWALGNDTPTSHPESHLRWGEVLYEMHRFSECREILAELHTSLGESTSSPFWWRTEELLGQTYGQLGENQEGIRYLSSSLQRKRQQFGDNSVELGVTLKKLSVLLKSEGDTSTLKRYQKWLQSLGEG